MPAYHGIETLDFDLRRFWETKEIPQTVHYTPEERQCEEHFRATHSRTSQGRYIVRLPFKTGPPISLGESRFIAFSSLHRVEQCLQRDSTKVAAYRDFLDEYENLGQNSVNRQCRAASKLLHPASCCLP